MCYRPLTIQNRIKGGNPLVDRSLLHVPCGHCLACLNEKKLSWFIRLYYEWLDYTLSGGYALYITTTYNSSCLPYKYHKPCFSKKDCQNYVKKVRRILGQNVKYFLVSEYGGCTHRPHYHIIFFIPSGTSYNRAVRAIRKSWSFGFTKLGKYNRGVIDRASGLLYVCKYLTKEDSYISKLRKECADFRKFDGYDYSVFKPFYLNSNNFGLSALSLNDYKELQQGFIFMPDRNLSQKRYKLPLYLDRKLHYDVKFKTFDPNLNGYVITDKKFNSSSIPFYQPNQLGLKALEVRLSKYISAFDAIVKIFIALPENTDLLSDFNNKFQTNFSYVRQIKDFLFKKRILQTLSIYNVVYRGYHLPSGSCSCLPPQDDYKSDYEFRNLAKFGLSYAPHRDEQRIANVRFWTQKENIDLYSDWVTYLVQWYKKFDEDKALRVSKTREDNTNLYLKYHPNV